MNRKNYLWCLSLYTFILLAQQPAKAVDSYLINKYAPSGINYYTIDSSSSLKGGNGIYISRQSDGKALVSWIGTNANNSTYLRSVRLLPSGKRENTNVLASIPVSNWSNPYIAETPNGNILQTWRNRSDDSLGGRIVSKDGAVIVPARKMCKLDTSLYSTPSVGGIHENILPVACIGGSKDDQYIKTFDGNTLSYYGAKYVAPWIHYSPPEQLGSTHHSEISKISGGKFVLSWYDFITPRRISFRLLNESGAPISNIKSINDSNGLLLVEQYNITKSNDGGFYFIYQIATKLKFGWYDTIDIKIQKYSATGVPMGSSVKLFTRRAGYTHNDRNHIRAITLKSGVIILIFNDCTDGESDGDWNLAYFDPKDNSVSRIYKVGTYFANGLGSYYALSEGVNDDFILVAATQNKSMWGSSQLCWNEQCYDSAGRIISASFKLAPNK